MTNKNIDITGKYTHEIQEIGNKLRQLKDCRVYEITNVKSDGYLANNIEQLKKMISNLIYKIEYGKESDNDLFSEALDMHSI